MNQIVSLFGGLFILLGVLLLLFRNKSGDMLKRLFQAKYAYGSTRFVKVTAKESSTLDKIGIILLGIFLIVCGIIFFVYFG